MQRDDLVDLLIQLPHPAVQCLAARGDLGPAQAANTILQPVEHQGIGFQHLQRMFAGNGGKAVGIGSGLLQHLAAPVPGAARQEKQRHNHRGGQHEAQRPWQGLTG